MNKKNQDYHIIVKYKVIGNRNNQDNHILIGHRVLGPELKFIFIFFIYELKVYSIWRRIAYYLYEKIFHLINFAQDHHKSEFL